MKTFLDVETCGFHGMAITLQYAFDDGPIEIHEFWTKPIDESLDLLKRIAETTVVGFNLAFDWFHLAKMYTTLTLASQRIGEYEYPDEYIDQMAILEEQARNGPCYKPKSCFDLMLHARKTEYQTTMDRGDIRIRRVPTALAWQLAKELEKRILFDPILFARRKNKLAPKFVVRDIQRPDGELDPNFKDIVLKFRPSTALKALAVHALKLPESDVITFGDIEVPKAFMPVEYGYAPFALAVGTRANWKGAWPAVIDKHIRHWAYHEKARDYARRDVDYTRRLYKHFDSPATGDDDSTLACMVASVRWRGYAIDIEGLKGLKQQALKNIGKYPIAPRAARKYIEEVMSVTEKAVMQGSTKKVILEEIAAFGDEDCPFGACEHCNQTGKIKNEAAERARHILEARRGKKEIELYDKLLRAGRFHFSVRVIGTLSSRMAGDNGLNPQGIKKSKNVRSKFPLAFGGLELEGGDFAGFEVVLADAAYGDLLLRKDLLTCEKCRQAQVIYTGSVKKCPNCGSNKTYKIHALFGVHVYPDMTYDDIKATDGGPGGVEDKYTKCKSAVFAMLYGGEGYTLQTRLGVNRETADKAYEKFVERYRQVGIKRQRVIDMFQSMKQTGGLGSRIEWHEPAEYIESLLGFRRYFVLENMIAKALFELANKPPVEWKSVKIKVIRRDREQTAMGALQSALYSAAFQMQAGNMRAAANHEIQSSGAQITKHLQRKIWDVQPHGANPWLVQPANVHDEILCPTLPEIKSEVSKVVADTIETFRPKVPLIEMEWGSMGTWADK